MTPQLIKYNEAERSIINNNPAIRDAIYESTVMSNGLAISAVNRAHQLQEINIPYREQSQAARVNAVDVPPFTGFHQEWDTWWLRFSCATSVNRWSEITALTRLKQLVQEGPGQIAVDRWEKNGGTSLNSLLESLTWQFRFIDPHSKWEILEKRVQRPC